MQLLLLVLAVLAEAAAPRARVAPRISPSVLTPAPLVAPKLTAPSLAVPAPSLALPVPVLTPTIAPAVAAPSVLQSITDVTQAIAAPAAEPTVTLGNYFDRSGKLSAAPVGSNSGSVTPSLTGKALLSHLREQTGRGYRAHEYEEASDHLFSVVDNVERGGVRGVVDAYSGTFVPGRGKDGVDYPEDGDSNRDGHRDNGMNVEHIWPQSFFSKLLPMRSDLHHLMTTFIHPNSIRGHLPFGEVKGQGDYSNEAGARRGQGVFEPPDSAKGKVARAMLYFYTRYGDRNIYNGGYQDREFWNGNLEMFLRWNRQFPPDQDERNRNDRVQAWQGNRNPYIDDPSLAERIGVEGFTRGPKLQRVLERAPERAQGLTDEWQFRKQRRHEKKPWRKRDKRKRR